ncbi:hypothetical protein ISS40_06055 [Candidatus Bathyarchaeota archaeon]|nr:hypothetical protein [Candidatus Bathyarchaeota archaeon]
MYKEHKAFIKPENENIKIWRYMDFTKFVSLIDKKALWFTKAEVLSQKYDKFEGLYPNAYVTLLQKLAKDNTEKERLMTLFKNLKENRQMIIVNSWNISDYESAALWNLYLKSDEGVAIQSTFKRFTKCFDEYKDNDVHIGKIKYIDYNKDRIPLQNMFYPFMHKRKSYEHEKELRALILKMHDEPERKYWHMLEPHEKGRYIPVNLDILIEKIYVSPTSPAWFHEITESIVSKYNINKAVKKSHLDDDPIY